MFIYFSINSFSREALKSGPLWIRLAAIWTWTVVARSWLYQRSHCQAHCLGRETEEKGSSCPEEVVVILTETVLFILVLLSYKALVVKTSLEVLLQGAVASAVRLAPRCCGILISMGLIVRLNDWDLLVLHNQLSSKLFGFPRTVSVKPVSNHQAFYPQFNFPGLSTARQCDVEEKSLDSLKFHLTV